MKKLFTLAVLTSLLAIKSWAGPYFYFTECPQLDYGTTTFNFTSVNLKSSNAWTGWQQFNYWSGDILDISSDNFSVATGDIIRVYFNSDSNDRDAHFKNHGTYDDFTELDGSKTWGNGYFQATATESAAYQLNTDGLNVQGCYMTISSVEIIPDMTTFTWTAKTYDGATITSGATESDGVYVLNPSNPTLTLSGPGYIVFTCERNGKKASYLVTLLQKGQKRHWDFTRHQLVVGPYGNGAWRLSNDTRWVSDQYSDAERVYKFTESINRVSASDIVAETNGGNDKVIWINQDGSDYYNLGYRKLSIRNEGAEFENSHSLNRFIGIEPGVTVKIPNLQAGDRVRMKIDKYGSDMSLTFSNALDALGQPITSNYMVGGSGDLTQGKNTLDAYYNFFVEQDGTFSFTQTDNQCYLMKIYDIEVYRGDFKMSNEILSSKKQLIGRTVNAYSMVNGYQSIADYSGNSVIPEQDLIKIDGGYSLHHRGKDEGICDHEIVKTSHNLTLTKDDFNMPYWNKDGKTYRTEVLLNEGTQNMIRNNEIFGSYILRIKVLDATQTYVTDYADRIVSIGYIEKVNHPITWDFTDLKTYLENEDCLLKETDYDYNTTGNTYYDENNNGYDSHLDLSIWKQDGDDWRLDFDRKYPNGAPLAWGTQLYAGTKMFDETRGIGFAPRNNNTTNYSLKITDGGLRIEDTKSSDWGWELSIHEIDGLAALYIRYEPIEGKTPYIDCQYNRVVDGTTGKPNAHVVYNKDVPDSNDKVQGHSAMIIWDAANGGEVGSGCTNEFKIYLNNVILKKIGTSKDQKKIGKTGYATESRARDIDHSLTSYFTGMPITAYTGYILNDDYSQVVLKEFAKDDDHKVMPAASTTGVNNGCILYHAATGKDKDTNAGLDGGIHLFVPDMHDTERTINVNSMDAAGNKNIMKSFKPTNNYFTFAEQNKTDVENYIYKQDDENSLNFLLSAKKYNYGTDGSNVESGYDVFFIRIDPNGKKPIVENNQIVDYETQTGWAYLMKNSAYIQMPNDKVKELIGGESAAKAAIVFEADLFNQGIITDVNDIGQQSGSQDKNAGWFMLDGRKLNSAPTQKGIYLVNGKKVLVK